MLARAGDLCSDQLEVERECDSTGDLVLQSEQIADVVIEAVGPQIGPSVCIDQLGVGAHLLTRAPYAPFQCVAHAELATDLFNVNRSALIGKGGATSDDEAPRDPRQVGRQVVRDAVCKVFSVDVLIEIGK